MADTDTPPRFFKVFISHFSSDSMLIPISYYDQLPRLLPKTAILQGTGGCFWNVTMMKKRDEVYFGGQGWAKFVGDNHLRDGDFLTFVYNGNCFFEVSIYGSDECKETRAVSEVEDDKEDSICSLSSKDTDTSSESEMANTIPRSKSKGKSKVEVVEESDDEEGSEDTDTDTCSEFKMAKTIPRSRNKGKKKLKVVEDSDEDNDSDDLIDAFGGLDFEENSNSDSSYATDSEDTTTYVKPKGANPKMKGKSKLVEDVEAISDSSDSVEPAKKRKKGIFTVKPKIKNPEVYLDNPNNVYFETTLKIRKFELLVHAQTVKDYCLKFQDYIYYIDNHKDGKLKAKTAQWKDNRVCVKRWKHICERNELKKEDGILCELFRRQGLVYAVRIHIIRAKDL